ncbi:hypothetical protein TNIN_286991, partial [Trichonephila inaurata madagascariensis]
PQTLGCRFTASTQFAGQHLSVLVQPADVNRAQPNTVSRSRQVQRNGSGVVQQNVLDGTGVVQQTTVKGNREVQRRVTMNKKERRRTFSLNTAFAELRDCIPNVPPDTKLSKIKTLKMATNYIVHLMDILSEKKSPEQFQDFGKINDIGVGRKRPAEMVIDFFLTIQVELKIKFFKFKCNC